MNLSEAKRILIAGGWQNVTSPPSFLRKGYVYFGHSAYIRKDSKLSNDLPELIIGDNLYIVVQGSMHEKFKLLCKSSKPEIAIAALRLQGLL